jgi:hypothetical protein
MSYFSRMSQNVIASDGNSSTANLTSGEIFTGTTESTLGVAGIQVSLKTDQNCTVYIEQAPDTTPVAGAPHWDIVDSYKYYANQNFGITVQAINSYVRVRVLNDGILTTTFFRLQTVLCPIVEAVPRTLDEFGNFKTAINRIQDNYGFSIENTPMGEQRSIIPTRLVGSTFDGTTVDSSFWTVANTLGGTTTQANAQVVLATNTTANGATVLHSFRRGRYVSGSSMAYRTQLSLSIGVTNNKRRWGVAYGATMPTITDGAYFQLDGITFSIVTLRAGVETKIDSGSFNGTLGVSYDPSTTNHTYEIYWTNGKVYFVIGDEILHTHTASAQTWAAVMSHYIFMDNVNSSNITSNNTITCRVSSIRRLGQLQTQPTHKYQSGTTAGVICKYNAGNLHKLIISNVSQSSVVTIYDGTTTGGTVLWSSGSMGSQTIPFTLDFYSVPFFNGLFFTITGSNCNVFLSYE